MRHTVCHWRLLGLVAGAALLVAAGLALGAQAGAPAGATPTPDASVTAPFTSYLPLVSDVAAGMLPTASYTGSPRAGQPPLTVFFTDTSRYGQARQFDFGDGVTSSLPNPTHTYTSDGAYTVTLVTTGTSGSATRVQPAFILVGGTPVWMTGTL